MKRRDFVRHLLAHGCELRHGAKHDVYRNPATGQIAAVPRHTELGKYLCVAICRQLGIPAPSPSA